MTDQIMFTKLIMLYAYKTFGLGDNLIKLRECSLIVQHLYFIFVVNLV